MALYRVGRCSDGPSLQFREEKIEPEDFLWNLFRCRRLFGFFRHLSSLEVYCIYRTFFSGLRKDLIFLEWSLNYQGKSWQDSVCLLWNTGWKVMLKFKGGNLDPQPLPTDRDRQSDTNILSYSWYSVMDSMVKPFSFALPVGYDGGNPHITSANTCNDRNQR